MGLTVQKKKLVTAEKALEIASESQRLRGSKEIFMLPRRWLEERSQIWKKKWIQVQTKCRNKLNIFGAQNVKPSSILTWRTRLAYAYNIQFSKRTRPSYKKCLFGHLLERRYCYRAQQKFWAVQCLEEQHRRCPRNKMFNTSLMAEIIKSPWLKIWQYLFSTRQILPTF